MSEALPHPDRARVLLTDPRVTTDELARNGEACLAAGRSSVAAMFFERAKSKEGLLKVKALALKSGDEFLLSAVARADASLVTEPDWIACAEAALAAGRFAFARDAFAKGGDPARSADAHQQYLRIFAAPSA